MSRKLTRLLLAQRKTLFYEVWSLFARSQNLLVLPILQSEPFVKLSYFDICDMKMFEIPNIITLSLSKTDQQLGCRVERYFHISRGRPVREQENQAFLIFQFHLLTPLLILILSYIVTELMWTNLQRLIERGPMEDAFARYFSYQILVRPPL